MSSRRGFDTVARFYWLLEQLAFGRVLERARTAHVQSLASCQEILVIGDGDGRMLAAMLAAAPAARFTSVDASPRMLALAAARASAAGAADRVAFHCADARTIVWPPSRFDAVVTAFVLDCFTGADVTRLVATAVRALKPGGIWLFVDFAVPRSRWKAIPSALIVGALYAFFRSTTAIDARRLPPSEPILEGAGLELAGVREFRGGLIRSARFVRRPSSPS